MRVKEFEEAILAKGLKPKEVRLEHNHVKWFICKDYRYKDIVVFDKEGKAYVVFNYTWPEEVHDIRIESYDGGVSIDGEIAHRAKNLDLEFKENTIPGMYVEETVCPYPERETCDGCPRYDKNEDICDLENPDF